MSLQFDIAPSPLLHFGPGKISKLPGIIKSFGKKFLLVTGERSFVSSPHFDQLRSDVESLGISLIQCKVPHEPTPQLVDNCAKEARSFRPDCVVAIGGGSVMDAGKAISAMIPLNEPVKMYLEGVGQKNAHPGIKLPFIAVPTTAGTGSEAARNAVLSEIGDNGFKRSLRHNNFVPNVAIVDPSLTIGCPPETTASSGMDAFTQLLESYVSTAANEVTDALAMKGIQHVSRSLLPAYRQGDNVDSRISMALGAYLSGITLTNAGLGLVHGFASSIGGYFPIAHGVICSTLMFSVNTITVKRLRELKSEGTALAKFAAVGKYICPGGLRRSENYYVDYLLDIIRSWTVEMKIPRLGQLGIAREDFERIISITENKNNPISLTRDEMFNVLEMAS